MIRELHCLILIWTDCSLPMSYSRTTVIHLRHQCVHIDTNDDLITQVVLNVADIPHFRNGGRDLAYLKDHYTTSFKSLTYCISHQEIRIDCTYHVSAFLVVSSID